jgi:DNA-binding CsgD family transcriptional regulator
LLDQLSARERQIAALVLQAKSNKQIARQLAITEGTVKCHLHAIYTQLGVGGRGELIQCCRAGATG